MGFSLARRTSTLLATGAALMLATTALPAHAAPPPPPSSHVQPQIIGGVDVPNDAYPFMAALLEKGSGNARERAFCGGSLITADTIMTAAHCVIGADPSTIEVVVGRTVLSNNQQGQVRNVAEINSHPLFGKQRGYDFALLQLDRPVQGIRPVHLPTKGTDGLIRPGTKATVIGWGNTDTELGHFPDRLREVPVPILSHNECEIAYPSDIGLDAYDRATEICAGVEGKDSCQGDSGGPIFRTVPGTQTHIQIGIVSRGEGCAAQGGPGIYTYTGSQVLWDTMKQSKAPARP